MLPTLVKIGNQLLEGKSVWARLTTEPKFDPDKKNWICPILFDCIDINIRILKDEMELFREGETAINFRFVPPAKWGPRGKKCSLTVAPKNFDMLSETLFGKNDGDFGSMIDSITDHKEFINSTLHSALKEINTTLAPIRNKLSISDFRAELNLGTSDEVVLYYAVVQMKNINKGLPIALNKLDGYDEFIIAKFGAQEDGAKGIDYITGLETNNAIEANFGGRYNIHKIFQTSSFNYASEFDSFKNSFQGDPNSIAALDKASEYVLNKLQTRIAGVNHIIIPNFRNRDLDTFDLHYTEVYLDKSSELLFKYQSLESDIERVLPDIGMFWINYIAFESDGNSFKIINHIQDVNSKYLSKLVEAFNEIGLEFKDYIGGKYLFNLQSIYAIIPVKEANKSKVNPALLLFKDILQQRVISSEVVFSHFIDLALCHWYGRYQVYKNVWKNDSFDFGIKDAVFKFSALIYTLKQLKLIHMNSTVISENKESLGSEFQSRIEDFFNKMGYSDDEKAIFYLGRVLASVAYAQYKKGHESKPILNKINFNGMDSEAIIRMSLDLREKARQYNIHRETDWDLGRFTDRFKNKEHTLNAAQNVFYLMAGYSFGLTSKADKTS